LVNKIQWFNVLKWYLFLEQFSKENARWKHLKKNVKKNELENWMNDEWVIFQRKENENANVSRIGMKPKKNLNSK
jgi:hypothetical protein